MVLKWSETVANSQSFQRSAKLCSQMVCWVSETASSSWKLLWKYEKRNASEIWASTVDVQPDSPKFMLCQKNYTSKIVFGVSLQRATVHFFQKHYNLPGNWPKTYLTEWTFSETLKIEGNIVLPKIPASTGQSTSVSYFSPVTSQVHFTKTHLL